MTKQYIKAYLTMVALTVATLFGFGFILGSFVFMTGGTQEAINLERSTWLPWVSQAVWFVAGLFAFRFSVRRFIETNKSEQENAK
jgi:uncharacterized BrkB/YihY/UPF0761 family membrane protein